MIKSEFIKELKVLADTHQIANEFDYVPDDISQIESGIKSYNLASLPEEIKKYSGLHPSEVTDRLIYLINVEYKKFNGNNEEIKND